ncbi:MAG: peptidoglycan DD-metalloendopeptidase family protein [Anaerolineales bacterium]
MTEEKNIPPATKNGAAIPHRIDRIRLWIRIGQVTLRDPLLRFAGHLALLVVIGLGVWVARLGWNTLPADVPEAAAAAEEPAAMKVYDPEPTVKAELPPYSVGGGMEASLARVSDLHTVFPERPRMDIVKYQVQAGDTLFGIAEKFGLKPESILWGNEDVLQDDPHRLAPGQELKIPPVDGTLYIWHAGDGLNGVARFFGVDPLDILIWPGNDLDPNMDPANPTIEAGKVLMIPGGHRELVTWSAPRIPRSNPAVAKILGPGACGTVVDGAVGTGTFIYPTPLHYLSGYEYSSIHPAIDLAGDTGHAIFASDTGVVVYAGWNDWGYGYVIVLDHGNGWQSLYAHLSAINVGCGQSVYQGDVIGAMGCTGNCTGPHLHFELMNDQYGKVNPLNYLQ